MQRVHAVLVVGSLLLTGCQTSAPPPPMCAPDAPRIAINRAPPTAGATQSPTQAAPAAPNAELPRLLRSSNATR